MMREAVISLRGGELEDLGLDELVSVVSAAGLGEFEEFACCGNGAVVRFEVDEPIEETEPVYFYSPGVDTDAPGSREV